jgi:hypothetical protein
MAEEFEKFRALVFEDLGLQRQLLAEPEVEPFLELVAAVGRERGFAFGGDELRAAMAEARRSWFERRLR